MPDVKIGVNADGTNVAKAIEEITDKVNNLAKAVAAAGKIKFQPADVSVAIKDIEVLNKQFDTAVKRSKSLRDSLKATGQQGKQIQDVDFNKLSVNPANAQNMRNRVFGYAAQGTVWAGAPGTPYTGPASTQPVPSGGSNTPNQAPPAPPNQSPGFAGRAVNAFAGGVGGGFGQITQGAVRGGSAAEGGGISGLLKGGGIAAGLFALAKGGQMVSEGYDMAKSRNIDLDSLKRQMGDLGVSFVGLKAMTDVASQGLGVNSKEFAQLAEQYNRASHNSDKTIEGLGGSVQSSVQFARAYGMDPSASAGFFGSMRNVDPKQNNRELAVQIADAVNRSGGRAMAEDVMHVVQSLASTTARMSLSSPNTAAYASAFGSMLSSGGPGMTSDNVAGMLSTANGAISNMGNAGEAGQNFTMGSFNKYGNLNPIASRALAAGGLFGDRNSVFGSGTQLNKYLGANGVDSTSLIGKNGGVSNWEAIRGNLMSSYKDPWLRLDGAQRYLGLQSPEQAAAMMNLSGKQSSGLSSALSRAGVKLSDLNAGGIQTMARIGGADSMSDLNSVYSDIKGRRGAGSLTDDERKKLDTAQGGGMEDFRNALLQVMKGKDQATTDAKEMLKGIKDLETEEAKQGDRLIAPMNVMRDALLKLAGNNGKSATAASLHDAAYAAEKEDINSSYDTQIGSIKSGTKGSLSDLEEERSKLQNPLTGALYLRGGSEASVRKRLAEIDAQTKAVENNGDAARIAGLEKSRKGDLGDLKKQYYSSETAGGYSMGGASGDSWDNQSGNAGGGNVSSSSGSGGSSKGGSGANSDIQKFISMGWSPKQAAGIVANLQAESGGNEKAVGDNGEAYGMAQWHSDRQADFAKFAGHDIRSSNHAEQLAFVNDELRNGKYKKVGEKLSHLSDAGDAGSLISREYERPRDADGEASKRGKSASEMAAASDTLNVNINLDSMIKDGKGGMVKHTMQTSVTVPRGSGVQTVGVNQ